MERPKCGNDKCENEGWICVGEKFYCGDCVVKWNNKQNERLKDEMKWE